MTEYPIWRHSLKLTASSHLFFWWFLGRPTPPFGRPTTHGISTDFHLSFRFRFRSFHHRPGCHDAIAQKHSAMLSPAGVVQGLAAGGLKRREKIGVFWVGNQINETNKIYILYTYYIIYCNWKLNQHESTTAKWFYSQILASVDRGKHPDEWQGFRLFELLQLVQDFAHQTVYQCINDSNKWLCAKCTISKHLPAIVWQ